MVPTPEQDSRICLSGCIWSASRSCQTDCLFAAASLLAVAMAGASGWRRGERPHGGREGGIPTPRTRRRSGEPRRAAEAASRRLPEVDGRRNPDRGWTVFQIPSTTWVPDSRGIRHVRSRSGVIAQAATLSSSSVVRLGGALLEAETPRRRCSGSVASVHRSTARENSPLHHSRQARPIRRPGQAGREIGRPAGFSRCTRPPA
jgi:hypothetical protein